MPNPDDRQYVTDIQHSRRTALNQQHCYWNNKKLKLNLLADFTFNKHKKINYHSS